MFKITIVSFFLIGVSSRDYPIDIDLFHDDVKRVSVRGQINNRESHIFVVSHLGDNSDTSEFCIKNDSVYLDKDGKRFFFMMLRDGYNDSGELIKQKSPMANSYYPFGNIVEGVQVNDGSIKIILERKGSYTTSLDGYVSSINIDLRERNAYLEYYDGRKNILLTPNK
jgi:hypothetical protein